MAEDCWSFPAPSGPEGRFLPYLPYFWGVWGFSKNKTAAKELIEALLQREPVEARCTEVIGYDVPPFNSMLDFKVWEEVAPPKGTVYNYPLRPFHNAEATYRGVAGPAGNRGADLQPRHDADDAGQAEKRPVDRSGDRLG